MAVGWDGKDMGRRALSGKSLAMSVGGSALITTTCFVTQKACVASRNLFS